MKTAKEAHLALFKLQIDDKMQLPTFEVMTEQLRHSDHCRDYSTTEFQDFICDIDCPVGGYQAKGRA